MEVEDLPEVKEAELPIIPNYLSNPPFMYSKLDSKVEELVAQLQQQSGSGDLEPEDPSVSPTHQPPPPVLSPVGDAPNARFVPVCSLTTPAPLAPLGQPGHPSGAFVPLVEQNGMQHPHPYSAVNGVLPMDLSSEPPPDYPPHAVQNGAGCTPPRASPSPSSGSQVQAPGPGVHPAMTRQPSVPQQLSSGPGGAGGGAMPAFQPFFFTSTFPVNVQGTAAGQRPHWPPCRPELTHVVKDDPPPLPGHMVQGRGVASRVILSVVRPILSSNLY